LTERSAKGGDEGEALFDGVVARMVRGFKKSHPLSCTCKKIPMTLPLRSRGEEGQRFTDPFKSPWGVQLPKEQSASHLRDLDLQPRRAQGMGVPAARTRRKHREKKDFCAQRPALHGVKEDGPYLSRRPSGDESGKSEGEKRGLETPSPSTDF